MNAGLRGTERKYSMTLSMIKIGEKARVLSITGADSVKKHLGALGVVPGTLVVVCQVSFGNMIIGVHDSRLAINEDVAQRICVAAA